ncbi:MAG: [FeFe] hydrogenase H-cluster radical SAM maturase HydG [Kiritimatiellae bacterium]|nr:[FeFe] hydrogenase H-cluster radical SAM maturase HydG [Kiritimatiellia bacterium]
MSSAASAVLHAGGRWAETRIAMEEIAKWRPGGCDFLDANAIRAALARAAERPTDPGEVRAILAKSRAVQTLSLDELATLLHVRDPELWAEMRAAAAEIKRKVYDNRIVTFAPLYIGNACVNDCQYCGLRSGNRSMPRQILTAEELRAEVETLAGRIGHKRLIIVFGEHPATDVEFMCETIRIIYSVKVRARVGWGQIRRVNVNAPPLRTAELRQLKQAGLGTYQVFQETYDPDVYRRVHPSGFKANYAWRLYTMHRAMEAGIDDVGLGALFGLADWRFEVMGLLAHAIELERACGIGPHTISFPRLEPADNAPYVQETRWRVSDEELERAVVLIRLAVPYTGMILTAREGPAMRRRLIGLGVTQTDASSRIEVGGYAGGRADRAQDPSRQQFELGDTRSLDDLVRELAQMGMITSFCTAGYRCGRTGQCIMDLLRSGAEGRFCKLNAIITYREWLDDFASDETRAVAEPLLQQEVEEVRRNMPRWFPALSAALERTAKGERDLYF